MSRIIFVKSKDNIDLFMGKLKEHIYIKIEADDDLEVAEDFGNGIDWKGENFITQRKLKDIK